MSPADLPQQRLARLPGRYLRPTARGPRAPDCRRSSARSPAIHHQLRETYETLNATPRTLLLDSNGILYKETTPGTLANVASGLAPGSYANSTTLFGREYLALVTVAPATISRASLTTRISIA